MIKTKFFKLQFILGGIAILLSLGMLNSNPAWAQTYPDKTITLLVPLQAGSAGDTVLRVVAQKMAENMKQAIVVENQAGVSGMLGAERISRAAPDGYFIGGISDSVLNFAANLVAVLSQSHWLPI
jgi:tripartite-type tricarboxylate transporter receptor subunit TctC